MCAYDIVISDISVTHAHTHTLSQACQVVVLQGWILKFAVLLMEQFSLVIFTGLFLVKMILYILVSVEEKLISVILSEPSPSRSRVWEPPWRQHWDSPV